MKDRFRWQKKILHNLLTTDSLPCTLKHYIFHSQQIWIHIISLNWEIFTCKNVLSEISSPGEHVEQWDMSCIMVGMQNATIIIEVYSKVKPSLIVMRNSILPKRNKDKNNNHNHRMIDYCFTFYEFLLHHSIQNDNYP